MARGRTRIKALLLAACIAAGLVVVNSGASATITQPGPNNYAGPLSCPRPGFDWCTNDTSDVVQSSNGGQNVFDAAGSANKVSQTNTTGPNTATCNLSANADVTSLSCDLTLNGDGGNTVNANIVSTTPNTSQSSGAPLGTVIQDAFESLKVVETSTIGNNSVNVTDMKIQQNAETHLTDLGVPVTHSQEGLAVTDINQQTQIGNNSAVVNHHRFGSSIADGASPSEVQDVRNNGASDPNNQIILFQRATGATGTNYAKARGVYSLYEEAHIRDINLPAIQQRKQHQWHVGGGWKVLGDADAPNNPSPTATIIDFGSPPPPGADCTTYDGFQKLGTILTFEGLLTDNPSTTPTDERRQDDKLPVDILPLTGSPDVATVAACSKLEAPAGTAQTASLSVDGHADQAVTGAIAATLVGTTSSRIDFSDQTVHESIVCTPGGCTTTAGGVTGSGTNVSAVAGTPFAGQVASFRNADPTNRPVTSATINWGDGSAPSTVPITDSGTYPQAVNGTHTWNFPGTYPISVTLKYADTSTAATMSSTATVSNPAYQFPAGGAFVIGDKAGQFADARPGSNVTFWSEKWNPPNPMSSGKLAPSSFKGLENTVTNPTCGQPLPTWETRTGNSPPPPAGTLPRYMGVIVASNIAKNGNTPTGNIARIVIVDTLGNTYAPNPSSDGKGVVVAVVCSS